jgi:hypothetical protein
VKPAFRRWSVAAVPPALSPLWRQALLEGSVMGSLAGALSTIALAILGRRQAGSASAPINAVSHYKVVPRRLTPGYEHRLDGSGMLAVYATLALGFALGAMSMGRSSR